MHDEIAVDLNNLAAILHRRGDERQAHELYPVEILAPRSYWGEDRHPVRVDPALGSPTWFEPPGGYATRSIS